MRKVIRCTVTLFVLYTLLFFAILIVHYSSKVFPEKRLKFENHMKEDFMLLALLSNNNSNNNNNQTQCKYLWKTRTEDAWFEQNFKSSLKPTWSARHANISEEAFQWWSSLSSSNQSYQTVFHLAQELVADQDGFPGYRPNPCVRCAVVGNSGNLKRSGYGRIIDVHNIIIRMNNCPTKGYEKDVGSRTTHYIAYPNSYNDNHMANASLIFAAFKFEDMTWLKTKVIPNSNHTKQDNDDGFINKKKVYLLNPELMWHIKHQWGIGKGRWASTGILSVFFALQTCDVVNVFGFGSNHLGYWDHYFEENNGEKNSAFRNTLVHDSDAEKELLERLVNADAITIFKGYR